MRKLWMLISAQISLIQAILLSPANVPCCEICYATRRNLPEGKGKESLPDHRHLFQTSKLHTGELPNHQLLQQTSKLRTGHPNRKQTLPGFLTITMYFSVMLYRMLTG